MMDDPAIRFEILAEDFHCDELRSSYCQGMTYTLRPGNALLAAYLDQWVKDGVAKVVPGGSTLTGNGAREIKWMMGGNHGKSADG